jgi:uncharacterized membrane protein
MNISPAAMLLISPLVLGESPSAGGAVGVLLIGVGAYIMFLPGNTRRWYEPFRALWHSPGGRLMLGVAVVAAITSTFDRLGIQNSGSVLWGVAISLFISTCMFTLHVWRGGQVIVHLRSSGRSLLAVALFQSLVVLSQSVAMSLTQAPYVISMKRCSALFAVLLGYWLLRERGLRARMAGVAVMLLGVLLIALAA